MQAGRLLGAGPSAGEYMSDLAIVEATSADDLSRMLPQLTADQRVAAKAKMKMHKEMRLLAVADRLRTAQLPSAMKQPMTVRIKEFNGAPVRGGWFLFGEPIPGWRVIRPGEVVCVDMADELVRASWADGYLELTDEQITRPLVYPSPNHARLTDPVRRKRKKTPKKHVERVLRDLKPLTMQLRKEYNEIQQRERSDTTSLPGALNIALKEQELNAALTSAEPAAAVEVQTNEDGDPIVDENRTVRRRRRTTEE